MILADLFADQPAWQEQALCAQVGGEAFFPEQGNPAGPAKRICARCPVQVECLEYALDNNEPYGVWGGMTPEERKRAAAQRRKAAAA